VAFGAFSRLVEGITMALPTEALSMDLLEQVLNRLALSDRPAPTLDGLQTLYAAWCRKVPFDNVRKLIHLHSHAPGPLPGDDPAEFLEAWLAYGTGGTCWAGNGALHAVLVSLGFEAIRGMGTMHAAPEAPPTHGTVVVTCGGSRYLVDASIMHGAPLPLHESEPTGVGRALRQAGRHLVHPVASAPSAGGAGLPPAVPAREPGDLPGTP
jgi:arylamine N-acetyltransferase